MDIVIIFNGLGNQMSQYAFYLQKKQISTSTRFIFEKKSANIHNGFELSNVFDIAYKETLLDKVLYLLYKIAAYKRYKFISLPIIKVLNYFGIVVINENQEYDFKPEHLKKNRGIRFFVGGWHAEKYFLGVKDAVMKSYQFKIDDINVLNKQMAESIRSVNSVSVHIRRGDYLDPVNFHVFGSVCTLNYYRVAMERMRASLVKPVFFIFTNDIIWAKDNFKGEDCVIVNINSGRSSWCDMYLISNCKHHINSNGTFSWWSAWLDKKPDKIVIVPKHFVANKNFTDIYPDSWIKVSDY